jgi:hypothetical protein
MKFRIGLLAWPVSGAGAGASDEATEATEGRGSVKTLPMDQAPDPLQLAQIRAEAGALWLAQHPPRRRFREPHTNWTAVCTCLPNTADDPACPLHGAEAPPDQRKLRMGAGCVGGDGTEEEHYP